MGDVILRYPPGCATITVAPDLGECIGRLCAATDPRSLLETLAADRMGWTGQCPSPQATWYCMLQEIRPPFAGKPGAGADFDSAMWACLAAAVDKGRQVVPWATLKPILLDRVDVLSGWEHSHERAFQRQYPVTRQCDEYFEERSGETYRVLGRRTEREERWDCILTNTEDSWRPLHQLLRVFALMRICSVIHAVPETFPAGLVLWLPESNGSTGFLHWKWQLAWPYAFKPLEWRPDDNSCDPKWLAADLMAAFVAREGFSEHERIVPTRPEGFVAAKEGLSAYPAQIEVAVETPLGFKGGEVLNCTFEGHPVVWINQTDHRHALLLVPSSSTADYREAFKRAMSFLSALSFESGQPVRCHCWIGRSSTGPAVLIGTKREGSYILSAESLGTIVAPSTERERQARAYYREATGCGNHYYAFLNYYKVVQFALAEDASKITTWIEAAVDRIRDRTARARVAVIRASQPDLVSYLFHSGRCAIAHTSRDVVVDPDDLADSNRIQEDLPVVRALARQAIESGLFK